MSYDKKMEALILSNADFMFGNDQMTFGPNQAPEIPTSNEVQSINDTSAASHQGIGMNLSGD
jgi:hypothetical protein